MAFQKNTQAVEQGCQVNGSTRGPKELSLRKRTRLLGASSLFPVAMVRRVDEARSVRRVAQCQTTVLRWRIDPLSLSTTSAFASLQMPGGRPGVAAGVGLAQAAVTGSEGE